MSDAKVENTYYIFSPQGSNQERISKGQVVIFDGFLKVYHYVDAEDTLLPAISQ
jgi:DNA topoisomerase IA